MTRSGTHPRAYAPDRTRVVSCPDTACLQFITVSSLPENPTVTATGVALTPAAVEKVKALLSQEGRSDGWVTCDTSWRQCWISP